MWAFYLLENVNKLHVQDCMYLFSAVFQPFFLVSTVCLYLHMKRHKKGKNKEISMFTPISSWTKKLAKVQPVSGRLVLKFRD